MEREPEWQGKERETGREWARLSMYMQMMEREFFDKRADERTAYETIDLSIREAMIQETVSRNKFTKYHEPVGEAVTTLYTLFPRRDEQQHKSRRYESMRCPNVYEAGRIFCEARKESDENIIRRAQKITFSSDAWALGHLLSLRFSELIDPINGPVFAASAALANYHQRNERDEQVEYLIERVAILYGHQAPGLVEQVKRIGNK